MKTMKDTLHLKREKLCYTKHLHYLGWAIFLEKGALYNYFRRLLITLIGHPVLVQLRIASKNDTLSFFCRKWRSLNSWVSSTNTLCMFWQHPFLLRRVMTSQAKVNSHWSLLYMWLAYWKPPWKSSCFYPFSGNLLECKFLLIGLALVKE